MSDGRLGGDASGWARLERPRLPSPSRTEAALWGLAVVAMVADLVATVHGLGIGLRELNPVARWALELAGPMGFVWLKTAALGVAVACRSVTPDRVGAVVPAALAVPWSVAAALNAATILSASTVLVVG